MEEYPWDSVDFQRSFRFPTVVQKTNGRSENQLQFRKPTALEKTNFKLRQPCSFASDHFERMTIDASDGKDDVTDTFEHEPVVRGMQVNEGGELQGVCDVEVDLVVVASDFTINGCVHHSYWIGGGPSC
ncbi:hypothetical protein BLNAU_24849 [Blattamonas nauphoetae]|uniref:Uncharacterized protein n=1 Tax=Blattamonas nauphoetae TaxID=2049346 RepID=A0ABQ9WLB1_9EUKA|nr:hypothetical protein BLNAU_24849 [Blattamonas nauphoetae]